MNMLHRRWFDYRPGRLGKNTILGSVGLGFRAVIQAVYLFLVSRWLGAEGYGGFSGAVALVILVAPLASWGTTYLIPRHIARDRNNSRAMWATALVQTSIIGSLLTLLILMIAAKLPQLPLSWVALLLLAVAELVLLPLTHAVTSQFYALEYGMASAISMCLIPLGRVLAMLMLIVWGMSATPAQAVFAHFVGSMLGLWLAFMLVVRLDGWPDWRRRLRFWQTTREGGSYALSNAAGASYQEIDKVLMLQILGAAAAGNYSLSFRVASIFVLPISALIGAALPRLMMLYEKNEDMGRMFGVMLATALGYGLLAGMAILLVAPGIPWLFGSEYSGSVHLLMWLALWPLPLSLRQVSAAWLTANNLQNTRTILDLAGLALVVVCNLVLLPWLGQLGAAASLIASEAVIAALFFGVIRCKRNSRAASHPSAGDD